VAQTINSERDFGCRIRGFCVGGLSVNFIQSVNRLKAIAPIPATSRIARPCPNTELATILMTRSANCRPALIGRDELNPFFKDGLLVVRAR